MTPKTKPSKETLLNSYIDVEGWGKEEVLYAAKWLAENTGTVVSEEDLSIQPDLGLGYHFLIADRRDNTVWVAGKIDVAFKGQLTDLSFMRTDEEEPMNTLETLKKAEQELSFAEDCLKASQEAVEDAQKAYTAAYKAFKKEADGLLREDDTTSEDDLETFLAYYLPATTDYLEDMTEGVKYLITRRKDRYSYVDDSGDDCEIDVRHEFIKFFERVVE